MNQMKKIDGMLLATFLATIFYSSTYPYIHKEIMSNVSDSVIALNQIVNCVSIIVIGGMWNKKSDKLFKHYPVFCICESLFGLLVTLWVSNTHNIMAYYIADTLVFSIITRNICCGAIKLRAIRYTSETERERFDNNNNSAYALATIVGSIIAMMLNLDFIVMLWIATFGNMIDNVFYLWIFKTTNKRDSK